MSDFNMANRIMNILKQKEALGMGCDDDSCDGGASKRRSSGSKSKGRSSGSKGPSKWIRHVKKYAKDHDIPYGIALKRAAPSYCAENGLRPSKTRKCKRTSLSKSQSKTYRVVRSGSKSGLVRRKKVVKRAVSKSRSGSKKVVKRAVSKSKKVVKRSVSKSGSKRKCPASKKTKRTKKYTRANGTEVKSFIRCLKKK